MITVAKLYKSRRNWYWQLLDKRNGFEVGSCKTGGYQNRHQMVSNLKRVTGVKYVPDLGYGTKEYTFEFERDGDGAVIHQEGQ